MIPSRAFCRSRWSTGPHPTSVSGARSLSTCRGGSLRSTPGPHRTQTRTKHTHTVLLSRHDGTWSGSPRGDVCFAGCHPKRLPPQQQIASGYSHPLPPLPSPLESENVCPGPCIEIAFLCACLCLSMPDTPPRLQVVDFDENKGPGSPSKTGVSYRPSPFTSSALNQSGVSINDMVLPDGQLASPNPHPSSLTPHPFPHPARCCCQREILCVHLTVVCCRHRLCHIPPLPFGRGWRRCCSPLQELDGGGFPQLWGRGRIIRRWGRIIPAHPWVRGRASWSHDVRKFTQVRHCSGCIA